MTPHTGGDGRALAWAPSPLPRTSPAFPLLVRPSEPPNRRVPPPTPDPDGAYLHSARVVVRPRGDTANRVVARVVLPVRRVAQRRGGDGVAGQGWRSRETRRTHRAPSRVGRWSCATRPAAPRPAPHGRREPPGRRPPRTAEEGTAEIEERLLARLVAFVADHQPPVTRQPGACAFHGPAMSTQTGRIARRGARCGRRSRPHAGPPGTPGSRRPCRRAAWPGGALPHRVRRAARPHPAARRRRCCRAGWPRSAPPRAGRRADRPAGDAPTDWVAAPLTAAGSVEEARVSRHRPSCAGRL